MFAKIRKTIKNARKMHKNGRKCAPNEKNDHSVDPLVRIGYSGVREAETIKAEVWIRAEELKRRRLNSTLEAQKFLALRMLPNIAQHVAVSKIYDLDEQAYIMIGEIKVGHVEGGRR